MAKKVRFGNRLAHVLEDTIISPLRRARRARKRRRVVARLRRRYAGVFQKLAG